MIKEEKLAGPWRRFCARWFDIYIFVVATAFIGEILLAPYSKSYVELMTAPNNDLLIGLVFLPFAFLLEAIFSSIAGTSPGKFLLGINVVKHSRDRLTLSDWLKRGLNVWFSGLALGVPFVSLITMWREYKKTGMDLPASYDEKLGFTVIGKELTLVKKLVAGLAMIAAAVVMIVLSAMSKETDAEALKTKTSPPYSWQNPITKNSFSVDAIWKYESQTKTESAPVYIFTEATNHAAVILGLERFEGSLQTYVRAFMKGNEGQMNFDDGGLYTEPNGVSSWVGVGTMSAASTARLRVEIRKDGANYWRVVTVQERPYDFSDNIVVTLVKSLWSSSGFQTTTSKSL
jgi:uncharacterized RDD family membrane protein YckC